MNDAHVTVTSAAVCKTCPTFKTDVRALFGVGASDVNRERIFVSVSGWTLCADKWFRLVVNSANMSITPSLATKWLAALRTRKLLCLFVYNLDVITQHVESAKALVALRTNVRAGLVVHRAHVDVASRRLRKPPIAFGTGEWLDLVHLVQMLIATPCVCKTLWTVAAGVYQTGMRDSPMVVSGAPVGKRLGTFGARVQHAIFLVFDLHF